MYGIIAAEAVYSLATAWDAYCTYRVMKNSPNSELNPAVKAIAAKNGILAGVLGGVVGPSIILGTVGAFFPPVLYMLTGARATYGFLQFESYRRGLI